MRNQHSNLTNRRRIDDTSIREVEDQDIVPASVDKSQEEQVQHE